MNNARSPKQRNVLSDQVKVIRYYAAFSSDFVEDTIQLLKLEPAHKILDPWNGSGTTTSVASRSGIKSYGYDLNPAAQIMAQARLANLKDFNNAKDHLKDAFKRNINSTEHMPLSSFKYWFSPKSINALEEIKSVTKCISCPSARSLVDTAIVNSIREQLSAFKSKNPAWLKVARADNEIVDLDSEQLEVTAWAELLKFHESCYQNSLIVSKPALLGCADAQALPLKRNSIDAVITSPPYCTRIDYAIATLVELAWLGYDANAIKTLRSNLIGTPRIRSNRLSMVEQFPNHVTQLLADIKDHTSIASNTYYYKTFFQFFSDMQRSFKELHRVIRPEGQLCIVVQDSFYKEIPIQLSLLFQEMLKAEGFELINSHPYPAGGFNFIHGHKSVNEVALTCRKLA